MEQDKLKKYKTKLEDELKMVSGEIKAEEKPVDFGSDVDGFDEEADEAEELGNQLAVSKNLKDRLSDIEIALEKIREGRYGICEKCGNKIETEILDIDPESRFCKECKLAL